MKVLSVEKIMLLRSVKLSDANPSKAQLGALAIDVLPLIAYHRGT
jgi:hypothetical protein